MENAIHVSEIEDFAEWKNPAEVLNLILAKAGCEQGPKISTKKAISGPDEFIYYVEAPDVKGIVETDSSQNTVISLSRGTNLQECMARLCASLLTPRTSFQSLDGVPDVRQYLEYKGNRTEIIGAPTRTWLDSKRIRDLGLT